MELKVTCCQCGNAITIIDPPNNETGLWVCDKCAEIHTRKKFVEKCGELLRIAKPHSISCEYKLGKEIPENPFERYLPEDEYVLITCENGAKYVRPIEANSLCAIAEEIFKSMMHK